MMNETDDSLQLPIVSIFEANLLNLTQGYLGNPKVLFEEIKEIINKKCPSPSCLTATAVQLLQNSLRVGILHRLMINGNGWQEQRFLSNGKPKTGRLWTRHDLKTVPLQFSKAVLEFLIWNVAYAPNDIGNTLKITAGELLPADCLFFYLVYSRCRTDLELRGHYLKSSLFRDNPIIQLNFPADVSNSNNKNNLVKFSKCHGDIWMLIWEGLQSELKTNRLAIEEKKGQIESWDEQFNNGSWDSRILTNWLNALKDWKRFDLSRFLLQVLEQLLCQQDVGLSFWIGSLKSKEGPRMDRRLETHRKALALLQTESIFADWIDWARSTNFLDDDYDLARFWLTEWEHFQGDEILRKCRRILHEVEPV